MKVNPDNLKPLPIDTKPDLFNPAMIPQSGLGRNVNIMRLNLRSPQFREQQERERQKREMNANKSRPKSTGAVGSNLYNRRKMKKQNIFSQQNLPQINNNYMNKSNPKNYPQGYPPYQNTSGDENDLSPFRESSPHQKIINVQIDGPEMQNQDAFTNPQAAINYCDASNSQLEEQKNVPTLLLEDFLSNSLKTNMIPKAASQTCRGQILIRPIVKPIPYALTSSNRLAPETTKEFELTKKYMATGDSADVQHRYDHIQ